VAIVIAVLVVLGLFAIQAARAARPPLLIALGIHLTLIGGIAALDGRVPGRGLEYVAVLGGLALTLVALIRDHADRSYADAQEQARARRDDGRGQR
jgi:hypothetical protein